MTSTELKKWLDYDSATGVFRRIGRPRIRAGKVTGHRRKDGYLVIRVNDVLYLAHRLAWLYVTGKWPAKLIDHINGKKDDNRFANLREADHASNAQNMRAANRRSSTGFLGVSVNGRGFQAVLKAGGVRHRFGTYRTPEEAHAAYVLAKRKLHPRGNL